MSSFRMPKSVVVAGLELETGMESHTKARRREGEGLGEKQVDTFWITICLMEIPMP